MIIEDFIRTKLLASTLQTTLSGRFYNTNVPTTVSLPYLVFYIISCNPIGELERYRVQFKIVSTLIDQVRDLEEKLKTDLKYWHASKVDGRCVHGTSHVYSTGVKQDVTLAQWYIDIDFYIDVGKNV